jgi:hypothetical protein
MTHTPIVYRWLFLMTIMGPFVQGIHSPVPGFSNVTLRDLLAFELWQKHVSLLRNPASSRRRSVHTGARLSSHAQRKDARA